MSNRKYISLIDHFFVDTPPYFDLPYYNIRIRDHEPIDTYVMDFYFNDTDYADWFVDYQPEYDGDDYFYFDTRSSMYNVS